MAFFTFMGITFIMHFLLVSSKILFPLKVFFHTCCKYVVSSEKVIWNQKMCLLFCRNAIYIYDMCKLGNLPVRALPCGLPSLFYSGMFYCIFGTWVQAPGVYYAYVSLPCKSCKMSYHKPHIGLEVNVENQHRYICIFLSNKCNDFITVPCYTFLSAFPLWSSSRSWRLGT